MTEERPAVEPGLHVEKVGTVAVVTLERVRALNALTVAMRRDLSQAFPAFARDPEVYAVVLRSASPKAFSAGSDVREVLALAATSQEAARATFREEYALNWQLECFSKPTVSLIDGMVMGGGVGMSLYGTHRVAGTGYQFAMPETQIGLFPDVGVCQVFSRLPDEIGTYLALTGHRIGRADALALGIVTHCIEASEFDAIVAALANTEPVDPLLDERHADPGPGQLENVREAIARCFSAPTVEEIVSRLEEESGAHQEWARSVAADLGRRAPLSLKVTLRHVREARALDLRQVLQRDYRLACRFLEDGDFKEGVRAALVDKDGHPRWQPARLEDVTAGQVDRYFAPLGEADWSLPTRAEMQASRA